MSTLAAEAYRSADGTLLCSPCASEREDEEVWEVDPCDTRWETGEVLCGECGERVA